MPCGRINTPELAEKLLEDEKADLVVMAIGSKPKPSDELKAACEQATIPYHVVGDALAAPRLALNAIHEAYEAALDI